MLQEETKPIEVIETLNDELDKALELNEQLASGDIETVVRLLDTATDVQKMKVQNDVDLDQDKNLPDPAQFVAQSVQTVNNLGIGYNTCVLVGKIFVDYSIIFQSNLSLCVIENHI